MNKRGQIFLLAAIIIIAFLVIVTAMYNSYREEVALEDFAELSENYETEAPKVINKAIEKGEVGQLEAEALETFSQKFQDYAQQKDPNFGVMYVFKDSEGNVHIMNSLNNKVINVIFEEGQGGKETKISLLNYNEDVGGNICMDGLGVCTQATTTVSDFGEGFYKTNINGLPDKLLLKLEIVDSITGESAYLNFDMMPDFLTGTMSDAEVELGDIVGDTEKVATVSYSY